VKWYCFVGVVGDVLIFPSPRRSLIAQQQPVVTATAVHPPATRQEGTQKPASPLCSPLTMISYVRLLRRKDLPAGRNQQPKIGRTLLGPTPTESIQPNNSISDWTLDLLPSGEAIYWICKAPTSIPHWLRASTKKTCPSRSISRHIRPAYPINPSTLPVSS